MKKTIKILTSITPSTKKILQILKIETQLPYNEIIEISIQKYYYETVCKTQNI
jgi:hypothetical protein